MLNSIDLQFGDCLELMKNIPDGSVDLVLCDPPYGTMAGIDKSKAAKDIGYKSHDWDIKIDTVKLFPALSRILRPNGRCVLFAQEPYTSELITSAIPALPFSYRAVWKKNNFANALGVNKAMVSYFEDILIFSKIVREETTDHPLRPLFLDELQKSGKTKRDAVNLVGSSATHYFTSGLQFRMPTKEKFESLFNAGFISLDYGECSKVNENYLAERYSRIAKETPSVFNLWEGKKSKSNVLEYAKDNDGFHPTQKPVSLLEDLIKTFSNPDDLILDNCMGSGSTGVACVNTNRKFIGMELDKQYFDIAVQRIAEAQKAVVSDAS